MHTAKARNKTDGNLRVKNEYVPHINTNGFKYCLKPLILPFVNKGGF